MTEAVSDRELIAVLGGRLDGHEISGIRRRPYRYATSAPLEQVVVLAGGEERGRLILKDLSRDRLLGDALAAKPEFLYEPRRELEAYRHILTPAGIGPRCLAAVADPSGRRCWLLLEKIPGVELWQVGEVGVWEEVARWLGGFHARFAADLDELRAANPHLLDHTASSFSSWCERAREALAESADERSKTLLAALERYPEVVDALAELPRTFVHGELYPSNVLVVLNERPLGVYPVDWEMTAVGPGLVDLAALTGGWGQPSANRSPGPTWTAWDQPGAPAANRASSPPTSPDVASTSRSSGSAGRQSGGRRRSMRTIGWARRWSSPGAGTRMSVIPPGPASERILIVNADDFGRSAGHQSTA